jgi:hypothetical protein
MALPVQQSVHNSSNVYQWHFKNACAIPSNVHRCCVNLILTFSQNDELLCQSCVTPTDLLNQCHQGTAACSPGQEEPSPCPNVVWLQFKPYSHSTNLHESRLTEYTTITAPFNPRRSLSACGVVVSEMWKATKQTAYEDPYR